MNEPIPICAVEVGVHPRPYWRDEITGLLVCDRHRQQYNERDDLGPFVWAPFDLAVSGNTQEEQA